MGLKEILERQKKLSAPDEKTIADFKNEIKRIASLLEEQIKNKKINAEVFIGGSFAKGTLIKESVYDIDVFIRFDWRFNEISAILKEILHKVKEKISYEIVEVHGSRDYFKLKKNNVVIEIIPVCKIKKPSEARNVTDLSYFHINYVRKKLTDKKIKDEILLAKKFCKAQGVYGAESYIHGFSGYGLECLIIYYKSFIKMLKELFQVKNTIIIDPERKYRNKNDVLFSLNESKLQSPIVLVDPTWKDRNVLAALSHETFRKFQESARAFLKKPSNKFFEPAQINFNKLRNRGYEIAHTVIYTDRQEGDIAGTKMKKFSKFLESEIKKYFNVIKSEFIYSYGKNADFYIAVRPKKDIIKIGPPAEMKEHAKAFIKKNKNVFEKNGYLHSREKVDFSAKEFLKKFLQKEKRKINEMGISRIKIL